MMKETGLKRIHARMHNELTNNLLGCFGKADTPDTPDYVGAANATAQGNKEAVIAQTAANRVNQVTPQGNVNYAITGHDEAGNPTWTATQTYSPDQQAIYQGQTDLSKGLLGTAQKGLGTVDEMLGKPAIDESKLAQMPINPGESYTDAAMRLMQPGQDRQREMLASKLANQGITMGSDAYKWANQDQGDQFNRDALNAVMAGMDKNMTARQQGIQEQNYLNTYPLNIINALRTGSQVQNPTFTNVAQQGYAAGPDILGATQMGYNSDLANANAQNAQAGGLMSGLFSLGSAAMGSPWLMSSDERLKSNIKRIGTHDLGIGIYAYDINGHREIGVMAQELEKVMPEAVIRDAAGYRMVDYSMIGG